MTGRNGTTFDYKHRSRAYRGVIPKAGSVCSVCSVEGQQREIVVGVRRETIIFLEQGKYNPSLRLAYNIARNLGTSIEKLFLLDEDED